MKLLVRRQCEVSRLSQRSGFHYEPGRGARCMLGCSAVHSLWTGPSPACVPRDACPHCFEVCAYKQTVGRAGSGRIGSGRGSPRLTLDAPPIPRLFLGIRLTVVFVPFHLRVCRCPPVVRPRPNTRGQRASFLRVEMEDVEHIKSLILGQDGGLWSSDELVKTLDFRFGDG